jgi:hypothetical protein
MVNEEGGGREVKGEKYRVRRKNGKEDKRG